MLRMIATFIVVGTCGDSNSACRLFTMLLRRFAKLEARRKPLDLLCAVSEGSSIALPPVVLWNPPWLRGMHYIKKEITDYWYFPSLLLTIHPQESESTHTMAQCSIRNPIFQSCRMCMAKLSLVHLLWAGFLHPTWEGVIARFGGMIQALHNQC